MTSLAQQLDGFLLKVILPYPDEDEPREFIRRTTHGPSAPLWPLLDVQSIWAMQTLIRAMPVAPAMIEGVSRLVLMTYRESPYDPALVKRYRLYAASLRGGQPIITAAKVDAVLPGAEQIRGGDVEEVLIPALQHRAILNYAGAHAGVALSEVLAEVQERCPVWPDCLAWW
jgi:MoxR-like ATPase